MVQPASAIDSLFNAIISELNELVKSGADEFTVRRKLNELEAMARDLESLSIPYSLSVRGSIAAARGDRKEMHRLHLASLKIGDDTVLEMNYAGSMNACGLVEDAMEYATRLVRDNPGEPYLLSLVVEIAFKRGDERMFKDYAQRFYAATNTEHSLYAAYLEEVKEIHGLTDMCASATMRACVS